MEFMTNMLTDINWDNDSPKRSEKGRELTPNERKIVVSSYDCARILEIPKQQRIGF